MKELKLIIDDKVYKDLETSFAMGGESLISLAIDLYIARKKS